MPDDLINSLSSDLKPIKSINPMRLWAIGLSLFVTMLLIVVLIYQVRPELVSDAFGHIAAAPMVAIKPAYFLILGTLGLFAVNGLSRPEGHVSATTLITIGLLVALLFLYFAVTLMSAGSGEFAHQMSMPFGLCISTILVGGLLAWGALWYLWLRQTATAWPKVLGGISGLCGSGLIASAYAFHCNMDSPLYIGVFYALPVLCVTLMGSVLGGRLLRW